MGACGGKNLWLINYISMGTPRSMFGTGSKMDSDGFRWHLPRSRVQCRIDNVTKASSVIGDWSTTRQRDKVQHACAIALPFRRLLQEGNDLRCGDMIQFLMFLI